jgi:hypothetical protein
MPEYVELNGVMTWYDELGEGQPLLLLHPGGDARAWGPNLEASCTLPRLHPRTARPRTHP